MLCCMHVCMLVVAVVVIAVACMLNIRLACIWHVNMSGKCKL